MELSKEQEILKILFKDILISYNSRSISKLIGISHPGAFKILKKLEKRDIVKPKTIGKAVIYSLNFKNPLTFKEIEIALIIESQNHQRWVEEFRQLEGKVKFLVLFGSILKNKKEARDIDLYVMADKKRYKEIRKIIDDKNTVLLKKVHLVYQTPQDFKADLNRRHPVTIEIIKTGIVLFGQDEFIKIVMEK